MKHKPKQCRVWLVQPYKPTSIVSPNSLTPPARNEGTFHQNMRFMLRIFQTVALMPLYGINAPSAEALKYSLCSLRTLYSSLTISGCVAYAVIVVYYNTKTGCTFGKVRPLIWFAANSFVMYQFVRLAQKWPKLMRHWETFEKTVTHRDAKVHIQMRRMMLVMSVPIPLLATVEHAFSLGKDVSTAIQCSEKGDTMAAYFNAAFPSYFYFFEANYVTGVLLQVINFYATMAWSLTDAFILLVSLGLITQFRHFNKHIERFRITITALTLQNHSPPVWHKHRTYFTKLTALLDHVNRYLAILIVTSYVVNTFHICVQLLESTRPSVSLMRSVYFWFSLIYLIGKTLLVSIVASLINDESKRPIKILESVPAASYESEASRFMQQLTNDKIALGGMRFFYLTRTFIIKMIGTIVTYEIMLMQFYSNQREESRHCKG